MSSVNEKGSAGTALVPDHEGPGNQSSVRSAAGSASGLSGAVCPAWPQSSTPSLTGGSEAALLLAVVGEARVGV